MPGSMVRNVNRNSFTILFITEMIFLNLAWSHSYLGEVIIDVNDYYAFLEFAVFQHRALPSFIYCVVTLGCQKFEFGLNKPVDSSFSVFQIVWDFAFLNMAALGVVKLFFHDAIHKLTDFNWLIAGLITTWLVLFTYILVPNRAFFYPYDFSDFGFLILLAGMAFDARPRAIQISCVLMVIAAFNKESVLILPAVFFLLQMDRFGFIRAFLLASLLALCGVVGKMGAILFADFMMDQTYARLLLANQLPENIRQLLNPLFYFSMIFATAFVYVPLLILRRHFNYVDRLLLALSGLTFGFLFYTGISRELRIYSPVTVIFLVIIARHRGHLMRVLRSR